MNTEEKTEEETEDARLRSVAEALYQGLKGGPRAPPRLVSEVIPTSRPKIKMRFVGEGPGQVVYMARTYSPKVPPYGSAVAPLQVGGSLDERRQISNFLFLGEARSVAGGEGAAPRHRGRPRGHYATPVGLLRLAGHLGWP